MTTTAPSHLRPEVRQLLADPAITDSTPGEEFAQAAVFDGGAEDVTVPFRVYLPASFPLFAERPRYTVRHLLKVATIRDGATPYVSEAQPADEDRATSGTTYEDSLEASFVPALGSARIADVTVRVPIPKGLLAHPRLLAAFVDYRVLVRAGTRENEVLLHGDGDAVQGLLTLPGLRRMRSERSAVDQMIDAAAFVEETGGSCDGIVAHPAVYWHALEAGLLGRLAEAGVRIARTRMIREDQVLFGDFRAAATLLDPAMSSLTLRRSTGPDGVDVIEASSRVGLAVHLPQHFVLVDTGASG